MPTTHGLSFPTCLFHPGVYTFTSTVHRCYTSLSGSRQQAGSGSLRAEAGAGLSLGETTSQQLSHLEGVAHRPDNLPLPTTITSLTWREVTHRLNTDSHWPVSHAQSSTAWPQQPTGKTDTGFPNRLNNHGIDSRSGSQGCVTSIPCRG
jgi:hypothetical protein